MKKFNKEIAGEDEVITRAVNLLKEEDGIFLTKDELREVYDITAKYFRDNLKEGKWASVLMPGLGRSYYRQSKTNRLRAINKDRYRTTGKEQYKKREINFKKLYDEIEAHYQDYQPKKNVKKGHKWFHVIEPMTMAARRRGYHIEDIEEIQNKLV